METDATRGIHKGSDPAVSRLAACLKMAEAEVRRRTVELARRLRKATLG